VLERVDEVERILELDPVAVRRFHVHITTLRLLTG
jgi:hypothetical protein